MYKRVVNIELEDASLEGLLTLPEQLKGIILFSPGIADRISDRSMSIDKVLQQNGLGTFLFDYSITAGNKLNNLDNEIDLDLETSKLITATNWLLQSRVSKVGIGFFASDSGADAALSAAAYLGIEKIKAIACLDGQQDPYKNGLSLIKSPVLLLISDGDTELIHRNEQTLEALQCIKKKVVITGETYLKNEYDKLKELTQPTVSWFLRYLYYYPKEIDKDFIG